MKNLCYIVLVSFLVIISCTSEDKLQKEIFEIENGLTKYIHVKGDTLERHNILYRMEHHKVPGVSIAVIHEGRIKWVKGYGIANSETGTKIEANTLFQAGSISKPIAALAALKLVEEGKVDLDTDVNLYLKNWKIEDNKFTANEKVTLRRLLTHTAGLTIHGFPGYTQSDTFPSIEMVLNGDGNTEKVYVDTIPGSNWKYSGGGYTVVEKMIEDVSGLPLEEYMNEYILKQFGMANSNYKQPLDKEYHSLASAAFDSEGKMIEGLWNNYPEQAAAGLWTTPTDLANYCIQVQNILSGKSEGALSKSTIESMLTKYKNDWGLGPSLKGNGDSLIFQHGGKNAGFTNHMSAYAYKGNGVIVMTNADNGGKLMNEILRSVSAYYNWEIRKQKVVEVIKLKNKELNKFAGKYKLDMDIPGIGEYLIDIEVRENKLYVYDPNNGDENFLSPLEEFKFIDLEKGDEVEFKVSEENGNYSLVWNGFYIFNIIEG